MTPDPYQTVAVIIDRVLRDDPTIGRLDSSMLNQSVSKLFVNRSRRSYYYGCHVEWVELPSPYLDYNITLGLTADRRRTLKATSILTHDQITVPVPGSMSLLSAIRLLLGRMIMIRRPTNRPDATGAATCSAWDDYPQLSSFLTDVKYEDGTARQPGTILIQCDGSWRVMVKDPDNSRIAFTGGDDLNNVLLNLNTALETDDLDWRVDKFIKQKKK